MTRFLLLFVAATAIYSTPRAQAHSWYPLSCCSGYDCEMIPSEAVLQKPAGYEVHYVSKRFGAINEIIPMSKVKASQDANFHGCWRPGAKERVICFFAPLNV